jgi:2-phospho-L-lactate guanylyltransferase
VVAAPDWARSGTNALLLTPPRLIATRFGPGSLAAHEAAARAARIPLRLVSRATLGLDIDEPQQLEMLLERGGPRYAFLARALRQVS